MEINNDAIMEAVTEAFKDVDDEATNLSYNDSISEEEPEEKETTDEKDVVEDKDVDSSAEAVDNDTEKAEDTKETKDEKDTEGTEKAEKAENATEDKKDDVEDKKEESKEELKAPMQMKKEVVDKCWEDLPDEAKQEVIRLAQENERNYKRASEAEYNIKKSRETLKPVMGYVKSVAEESNISEDEVIRNSLDIIQHLNDNPTQTAKSMIEKGMIQFDDPVAIVNAVIRTYGLTPEAMKNYTPNQAQTNLANRVAQQTYEARQSKYVKEEDYAVEDPAQAFETYRSAHPEVEQIIANPELLDRFTKVVAIERQATPYLPHADILDKAMQYFTLPKPQAQTTQPAQSTQPAQKAEDKVVDIASKMNKVVTPKTTTPNKSNEVKALKTWNSHTFNANADSAARSAIHQAMRDLGLSD